MEPSATTITEFPTAPATREESRHPPLVAAGKIVEIIRKGQHGIPRQHVGPAIGDLALGTHRFGDGNILVQQVEYRQL